MTKSEVQEKFRQLFYANPRGTIEAATGFGKTAVATGHPKSEFDGIIQNLNKRKPGAKTIVSVYGRPLLKTWKDAVKDNDLKDVEVSTVNMWTKGKPQECSLLVVDEVHLHTGEKFREIFRKIKYDYILCLTATMPADEEVYYYLTAYAPVLGRLTISNGVESGFINNFKVYNLPVQINQAGLNKLKFFNDEYWKYAAYFDGDYGDALTCLGPAKDAGGRPSKSKLLREKLAKEKGVEEGVIFNKALLLNKVIGGRSEWYYHNTLKINVLTQVKDLFPDDYMITFNERLITLKKLTKLRPKRSLAYHGEMSEKEKELVMNKFLSNDNYNCLDTAKAINVGVDIPKLRVAAIGSFNSAYDVMHQRIGRVVRLGDQNKGDSVIICTPLCKPNFDPSKKPNTQDLKWLSKAQERLPSDKVVWIETLNELPAKL